MTCCYISFVINYFFFHKLVVTTCDKNFVFNVKKKENLLFLWIAQNKIRIKEEFLKLGSNINLLF